MSTPETRPRQFDLIAFDWDGTLFDSTAVITRSIQEAVRDVGGSVPGDKDAAYVIGMGLAAALAYVAPDVPPVKQPLLMERYQFHYAINQHRINFFDGVLPMLKSLKERQHLLAVATGKSRRGLNEALAGDELRGVFDASRTAEETAGKPHPLMLLELMGELGVAADRVLMVGDTTHDLQLALNAGCASVGVSYGAHDHADFSALSPLFVAHSVAELRQWLEDFA